MGLLVEGTADKTVKTQGQGRFENAMKPKMKSLKKLFHDFVIA